MQAVSRLVPATGQGQSASAAPAAATTGGGSAAPAAPATEGGRSATLAAARVHSLADCAQALWAQLSPSQRVEVRVRARTRLVVGTACSGTDCAIQCLEHLHSFTGWSSNHVFSCEADERTRSWILEHYSSLPALFSDVAQLGAGDAFNHVTGRTEAVPGVDLLIAGFVCKSVSVEYRDRGKTGTCVSDGTGQTGVTFHGVCKYVERFQPKFVICENVGGLLKRSLGAEPQILAVQAAFNRLGYTFQHVAVDTRDFFLPHRRQRVWMWALRDGAQSQADQIKAVIQNLPKRPHMPLRELLVTDVNEQACTRHELTETERGLVSDIVSRIRERRRHDQDDEDDCDIVIDLAKSSSRSSSCVNASPCVLPNSKLWLVREGRFMAPRECLALQGIWATDFLALDRWAHQPGKMTLLRDLAGNAFSTPVCMTVCLAVIMTAT